MALNATLGSDALVFVRTLDRKYLTSAMFESVSIYAIEVATATSDVNVIRNISLAVFITLLFVVYISFYNPMIWRLNDDTKKVCAMLLLVPINVLNDLPRMKLFVEHLSSSVVDTE